MSYIETSKIDVFPSTYRKEVPYGKFTSEQNFVNILNSITDKDSYVLSYESNVLKVVIHGYLFTIRDFNAENYAQCWLLIKIEKGSNSLVNFNDTSVTDLDVNGRFTGLSLVESEPTVELNDDYTTYKLKVVDTKAIVNKVRLSTDSIFYDDSTNLTKKIDSKQDSLSATSPIKLASNTISLSSDEVAKLDALESKGSNIKFVYFDKDGKAIASTATVGNPGDATDYFYTRDIYLEDGELVKGATRYFSTNSPDDDLGQVGDMWFKYNQNS